MTTLTRKPFTLIEFIAVVVIVAMVVGVVIGRVGKIPSHLLIEQVVAQVDVIMKEASNRAVMQGKPILVKYDEQQQLFEIESDIDGYAEQVVARQFSRYELPEDVVLEPVNSDEFYSSEGFAEFTYYPDGAGSGSAFIVKLKGHSRTVEVSPLTGMVIVTDEK